MDRDPEQRIGSTTEDSNDIINHPFFADIDWDALHHKTLTAPYIPDIRTFEEPVAADIEQTVEETIHKQDEAEALTDDKIAYIKENQGQFEGF